MLKINRNRRKAIWKFAHMDTKVENTQFGEAIKPFLERYFSSIEHDQNMLDKAFCKDMLRPRHADTLSSYLEKLNEAARQLNMDVTQLQMQEGGEHQIDDLEKEILEYRLQRKDKTIFLSYFLNIRILFQIAGPLYLCYKIHIPVDFA